MVWRPSLAESATPRMIMTVKGHTSINLPKILAKHVDAVIADQMLAYNSRDEFVRDAVRAYLRQLRSEGWAK